MMKNKIKILVVFCLLWLGNIIAQIKESDNKLPEFANLYVIKAIKGY